MSHAQGQYLQQQQTAAMAAALTGTVQLPCIAVRCFSLHDKLCSDSRIAFIAQGRIGVGTWAIAESSSVQASWGLIQTCLETSQLLLLMQSFGLASQSECRSCSTARALAEISLAYSVPDTWWLTCPQADNAVQSAVMLDCVKGRTVVDTNSMQNGSYLFSPSDFSLPTFLLPLPFLLLISACAGAALQNPMAFSAYGVTPGAFPQTSLGAGLSAAGLSLTGAQAGVNHSATTAQQQLAATLGATGSAGTSNAAAAAAANLQMYGFGGIAPGGFGLPGGHTINPGTYFTG